MVKNKTTLCVDNRNIKVRTGMTLLQACLDHDIYIPHLCHVETMRRPAASCRLCFVEIEGKNQPVTACTVRIKTPITVRTDTETVRRLQRAALNLLLSVHKIACKTCPANRKCELQKIARFLKVGLKVKGLPLRLKAQDRVDTHPVIVYWPNRCVLCGQCINACRSINDRPLMAFAGRGFDTMISFYASTDMRTEKDSCTNCTACIDACPVGALTKR